MILEGNSEEVQSSISGMTLSGEHFHDAVALREHPSNGLPPPAISVGYLILDH